MIARRAAALCCAIVAACAPNVPRLRQPLRIEGSCGRLVPRPTALESVMTSTDDKLLTLSPKEGDILRDVRAGDGAIAYWNAQPLALPNVAAQLGETDGYVRVDAAAVPRAIPGGGTRRIYLKVRDRRAKRWIALRAYDLQSVCVEGRRDI